MIDIVFIFHPLRQAFSGKTCPFYIISALSMPPAFTLNQRAAGFLSVVQLFPHRIQETELFDRSTASSTLSKISKMPFNRVICSTERTLSDRCANRNEPPRSRIIR